MQALGDFFGVALGVELEEAGEHLAAGWLGDGVADALRRLVEAVGQRQVLPAVGGGGGVIHFHMQLAQAIDVLRHFVWVVESVIGGSETFLPVNHKLVTVVVVGFPEIF